MRKLAWMGWSTCLALALVGCGGGGGGGDDTGVAAPTPVTEPAPQPQVVQRIFDSFGEVVWASDGGGDGSSGIGSGDSGADGSAADGKAIVGATVRLTDANGRTASTTTNEQGYYRLKVTGFTAPFVATVTKDGKTYVSVSTTPPVPNQFLTLNLSGLTDKVASDVAIAAGHRASIDLTPAMVASHAGAIQQSLSNLRTQLGPVIERANLATASFDPLTVPFRPNGQGYDFVLDNTIIQKAPDGATVVTISPTFGRPPLAGNWSGSVFFDGQTASTGTIPGALVPSEDYAKAQFNGTSGMFNQLQQAAINEGGVNVTISGNVATFTDGPDTISVRLDDSRLVSYQGCGACDIGSSVTYTVTLTFAIREGTAPFDPPMTTNVTTTYTRID